MPKYYIECVEEITRTFEVKAESRNEALVKFTNDGGKLVSEETSTMDISEVTKVEG